MSSTQDQVLLLLNTFFQEYTDYLFTKKYGKDWFQQELLPHIKKTAEENAPENSRNVEKYNSFLKKVGGSHQKTDMDVTLCCAVLLYDEHYQLDMDSQVVDSLHELRIIRNEYDHSTELDEITDLHLISKAIVHIQRLTKIIGEEVFSDVFYNRYEDVKKFVVRENTSDSSEPLPKIHKSVYQQAYEEAESLFSKSEYEYCYSYHMELAQLGFLPSMIRLGEFYQFGYGRDVDFEKAVSWYETAEKVRPGFAKDRIERIREFQQNVIKAQNGDSLCCFHIGSVYEEGGIVTQDMKKALEWYEKAMDFGSGLAKNRLLTLSNKKNIDAMYIVARRMEYGDGFLQNTESAALYYQRILETDPKQTKALKCLEEIAGKEELSVLHLLGSMYQQGRIVEKNMDKALEYYESAASKGYLPSQMTLGNIYYSEVDVLQNYEKAYQWFEKAANADDPQAQYFLGKMLSQGLGVPKNEQMAYQWYCLSAAQGNGWAQNNLAVMYIGGIGVAKNVDEALRWYHTAASSGEVIAAVNLANLYNNGKHIPKDYEQALKWYKKVVELGYQDSYVYYNIGLYYDKGYGTEQDLKEAVLCYQKAADLNDKDAQYRLGCLLLEDDRVEHDEKRAFYYLEKASSQKVEEATLKLGLCYLKGLGVKKDYDKAFTIFKSISNVDDAKAYLGYMYNFGLGTERDYTMAVSYYNRVKYNNEMAMVNLAHLYCLGYGTAQDLSEARRLYEYAAGQGNAIALYRLGLFYENGIKTYVQYDKARDCYQKAAEKGHKEAKASFERILREQFGKKELPEMPEDYLKDMMTP